ncbi:MAG: aldehyde ferredoxin oxidoreductase N-terminal domain-containing protein [Candidatus Freyarchaeota archaeon]
MEYYGYMGKTLFVDLSSGDIREEPLDANLVKKFVGGPGIGYRILFDMLKPGTDPLSPENPIVVGTGPLLGTLTPGAGKCYLAMKYPIPASKRQKKYFVSIAMGGSRRFGVMLKNAGYDHLVITGRAEKPSGRRKPGENISSDPRQSQQSRSTRRRVTGIKEPQSGCNLR